MLLHTEPLKYDEPNLCYAGTAAKSCDAYREGDLYKEFYKLCQRDEPWSNRLLNSSMNERFANISTAASYSLVERLAICHYSQFENFNMRLFHTYFWTILLEIFRLENNCDFNLGMNFFEVATVNFNPMPLLSSYSENNINTLSKLFFLRIFEITVKKNEHTRPFFCTYNFESACEKIYKKIKNEPLDPGGLIPPSNENIYNHYKDDYEFVDQHLPELSHIYTENYTQELKATYYTP